MDHNFAQVFGRLVKEVTSYLGDDAEVADISQACGRSPQPNNASLLEARIELTLPRTACGKKPDDRRATGYYSVVCER